MDFWQNITAFGESAFESVGEGIGNFADAFVDFKVQELAERKTAPDIVKKTEPVKGKTVEGRPIVVTNRAGSIMPQVDTNTWLLIGGALVLGVLLLKR